MAKALAQGSALIRAHIANLKLHLAHLLQGRDRSADVRLNRRTQGAALNSQEHPDIGDRTGQLSPVDHTQLGDGLAQLRVNNGCKSCKQLLIQV